MTPIVLACVVVSAFAGDEPVESTTRSFEGVGSFGIDSPHELYLVGGLYGHSIETQLTCPATAGLFPAQREPTAKLAEVLRPTDLAAHMPGSNASTSGAFRITNPGWVTLQIGTGPDCAWSYAATGRFFPEGEEPRPPGSLNQPWVLWSALAVVLGLAAARAAANRKRSSRNRDQNVRVLEPEQPSPV